MYRIITSSAYSTHSSTTPPSQRIKETIIYTETRIKPTAIPPYHSFFVSLSVSLYRTASKKDMMRPIIATGWYLLLGSPMSKSNKNAKTGIHTKLYFVNQCKIVKCSIYLPYYPKVDII